MYTKAKESLKRQQTKEKVNSGREPRNGDVHLKPTQNRLREDVHQSEIRLE